MSKVEEKVETL